MPPSIGRRAHPSATRTASPRARQAGGSDSHRAPSLDPVPPRTETLDPPARPPAARMDPAQSRTASIPSAVSAEARERRLLLLAPRNAQDYEDQRGHGEDRKEDRPDGECKIESSIHHRTAASRPARRPRRRAAGSRPLGIFTSRPPPGSGSSPFVALGIGRRCRLGKRSRCLIWSIIASPHRRHRPEYACPY